MPHAKQIDGRVRREFVPLSKKFDHDSFDCGVPELNDFLKTKATQYAKRKIAQTFVAYPIDEPKQIDGYFSISMNTIDCGELPKNLKIKYPRHPLPAALIGRLAVSIRCQKQGLGELLLLYALDRIVQLSEQVGCAAILVDAKNESAITFYRKYGFFQLVSNSNKLFLPINDAQELFESFDFPDVEDLPLQIRDSFD